MEEGKRNFNVAYKVLYNRKKIRKNMVRFLQLYSFNGGGVDKHAGNGA